MNGEQKSGRFFAHALDDMNLRILRMLEGTFSFEAAHTVKDRHVICTRQAHDVNITSPQRRCNVASTLRRRYIYDVASTLRRRYIYVMCLLGNSLSNGTVRGCNKAVTPARTLF